ncbi:MAG: hypothetical protein ABIA67_05070 [Candidatus Margulisiibacteriota bacterium]
MARISSIPPRRMPDSVRVKKLGVQSLGTKEFLSACKRFNCIEYTPVGVLGNAFEAYGYLQVLADPRARGLLDKLAKTFARNQEIAPDMSKPEIEADFDLNVKMTFKGHNLIILKHGDIVCFMANPKKIERARQQEIFEVLEAESDRDSEWPENPPTLDKQEGGNIFDGEDAQPLFAKMLLRRGPFQPQEGLRAEAMEGPPPSQELIADLDLKLEAKAKKQLDS